MENNEPRQIEIRRCRNILYSIGNGIILFGAWSVFKVAAMLFFQWPDMYRQAAESAMTENGTADISEIYVEIIALVMLILWLGLDLLVRIYVGRTAKRASSGGSFSRLYIFLICVLMVICVLTIALGIADAVLNKRYPDGFISSMVIELTSMIMMAELVAVSLRHRKLMQEGAQ